jgi:hypothetical protein
VDLGSALGLVSRTGRTQFRLTFTLDDNDDRGNDFAGFYSGENSNAARRLRNDRPNSSFRLNPERSTSALTFSRGYL